MRGGALGGFDRQCIPQLDKPNRVRTGCATAVQEDDDELLCGIVRTNQLGRRYIRPDDTGYLHACNGQVARGGPGRGVRGLFRSVPALAGASASVLCALVTPSLCARRAPRGLLAGRRLTARKTTHDTVAFGDFKVPPPTPLLSPAPSAHCARLHVGCSRSHALLTLQPISSI